MKRLLTIISIIFLFDSAFTQDSLETDSSDTTTKELTAPDLFEKSAKFKNFTVGMTGVGVVGITSLAVSDYGKENNSVVIASGFATVGMITALFIHANSLQKRAAEKLRTTLSSNKNMKISAGMTSSGVGITLGFN